MKISYLLFVVLLFAFACQSEQKQYRANISRLEKSLETELNRETAEELLTRYVQYTATYPKDTSQIMVYASSRAKLLSRLGQQREAAQALLAALATSPTAEQALQLAQLLEEKLNAHQAARTIYQVANEKFPGDARIQKKLNPDWAPMDDRMNNLRRDVFDEEAGRLDERAASDFLFSVEAYAALRPKDQKTPGLLFEAADVAGAMRNYELALGMYERVTIAYPDYDRAAEALFMQAFTLDSELKKYDEAKVFYEEFLAKYPEHELAASARFSLQNLGKSEEEIIQEFLRKQEQAESLQ